MEQKKKTNKQALGLYIVLAIMIVTIMAISIYTVVSKRSNETENPSTDVTSSDITTPPISSGENRVINPVEDITTEANAAEPDEVNEAKVSLSNVYVTPVSGNIIKGHSGDMPVYSKTMNDYRVHRGVDIAADISAPVCAFSNGIIESITEDPMMGKTVIIDHGDSLKSVYQNLLPETPANIEAGVEVKAGDVIGGVGETTLIELSEVPHIHFEIIKNGVSTDPGDYIEALKQEISDSEYEDEAE